METKVLIMTPDQPNEHRIFELPERPSYHEIAELMQLLIGCEHCEHVNVLADFAGGVAFKHSDMFVDEIGQQKRLPRNENATVVYRRNALLHQGVRDPESLPSIVGVAVLFERRIWF
jgi:hypothetical protein